MHTFYKSLAINKKATHSIIDKAVIKQHFSKILTMFVNSYQNIFHEIFKNNCSGFSKQCGHTYIYFDGIG